MFEKFVESARVAIFFARYEAITSGSPDIQPAHLEVAIRHLCPELPVSSEADAPFSLSEAVDSGAVDSNKDLPLSNSCKQVLRNTTGYARTLWESDPARRRQLQWFRASEAWSVDPRHMLLALAEERGAAMEQLKAQLFATDAALPALMPPQTWKWEGLHTAKLGVALLCARYERSRLSSASIHPEHLLLGLIFASKDWGASQAAGQSLGSMAALRREVSLQPLTGSAQDGPFSAEAQQVLRVTAGEAAILGHQKVGTVHLLLALLRMEDGFAAAYFKRLGMDLATARATVSGPDLA